MDIHELRRMSEEEASTIQRIFNPLLKDFSKMYDAGDGRKEYTVKAREISEFPTPIARHLKKHLIDFIMNEREVDPLDKASLSEIEREIEVNL